MRREIKIGIHCLILPGVVNPPNSIIIAESIADTSKKTVIGDELE